MSHCSLLEDLCRTVELVDARGELRPLIMDLDRGVFLDIPPRKGRWAEVAVTACADCGKELVVAQIVCKGHSCKAAWHRDDAGRLARIEVRELSA